MTVYYCHQHRNCHARTQNAAQSYQGYGSKIIRRVHENLCKTNNSVLSQNQAQHEVNPVQKHVATSGQREQLRHH